MHVAISADPPGEARLFNRNFMLLWQGQLVSGLGSQAFVVALMYWTMEATGSATVMALLMIASTLPAVLLGPVAGAIADRHSRKAIIVLGDLARGVVMLGVAVLAWTLPAQPQLVLGALFAASLVSGVIGAVFNPAVGAAIPDLVPAARLTTANALTQLSGQGAVVVGQAMGGVLYRTLGAPVLFLADGISFLISGASEAFIRVPERASRGGSPGVRSYLLDARTGFACVWRNTGLRTLVLTATVLNFIFMPMFVLLPFYVRDILHADAAWYGFMLAALSAGSVAGITLAGLVPINGARRAHVLSAAFLLLPALLVVLAAVRTIAPALIVLLAAGLLSGSINVYVITLAQTATAAELRARVLAIVYALAQAAIPFGMAFGGIAGDLSGMRVSAVLTVSGLLGLLTCGAALRSAAMRHMLSTGGSNH